MVRSLYSGVSGLKSHQTRMDVIGNNIANVNTYGFKASRTAFADIYYQYQRTESGGSATRAGNNSAQVGYGVEVKSIDKDMSISNFQTTSRTFDIAIAGDGFFICGTVDRNKQINSVRYTRMGNFGIDSTGNLVNSSNQFVLGTKNMDRLHGGDYSSYFMEDQEPADSPNELDILNINDLVWDAFKPQCQVDIDDIPRKYKAGPTITDGVSDGYRKTIIAGQNPYDTTQNIAYDYHMDTATPPDFAISNPDITVPGNNNGGNNNQGGGSPMSTAFSDDTSLQDAITQALNAATGNNGNGGGNNNNTNLISLPAIGEDPKSCIVQSDYILYSVNGKYVNSQGVEYDPEVGLYKDEAGNYYTYECVTYVDYEGNIEKDHKYTRVNLGEDNEVDAHKAQGDTGRADVTVSGVDAPDDTTGLIYTYNAINKLFEGEDAIGNTIYANMTDGSLKYSDLEAFSITPEGVLTAQYASEIYSLGRIELGLFDNVEGLNEVGGTQFIQTTASGNVKIKRPGDSGAGTTQSGKLEMSNVNLADEFSDMVVTQRGFQANARIITTSDSMLEELVNLKR